MQNLDKQVLVPDLRSHKLNRRFQVLYLDRSAVAHRHLGGLFVALGACSAEVARRVEAGNRGWRELGQFWFSHACLRVKRLLFLGKVYSAVLSGMLSYDLSARDLARLQKSITGKLRAIMQGRACLGEGEAGHRVALSTGAVLRYFWMAPVQVELLVGRLRMYFAWIREPRRHKHCLAVIFGRYGFEISDTLGGADGLVADCANSYAKRFVDDMREVVGIGECGEWSGDVRAFFGADLDESFVGGVLAIDPQVFRSRFLGASWAPPGWVDDDTDEAGEFDEVCAYECALECEDGSTCRKRFDTYVALATHRRSTQAGSHGQASMLNYCLVTNECYWCRTSFQDVAAASRHMHAAHRLGR